MKEHPSDAFKKAIPGPGSYKIPNVVGTEGRKFSMRPKTKDPKLKYTCRDAPGPGAYDFKPSINQMGKNFNSKFASSQVTSFNKTKGGRFGLLNPTKVVPGPGQYSPKTSMTKTGEYFFSKFHNTGARTQYHADRHTLELPETAKVNPGPGYYREKTEFGYYESKRKFLNTA